MMIKKNIRILTALLPVLLPLLVCCSVQEPDPLLPNTETPRTDAFTGKAILLLTQEAADSHGLTADPELLERLGINSIERLFPEAGVFEARHRAAGLHRWYRVRYDQHISLTKAGNDLSTLPGVEDVVFEPRLHLQSFFNDPYMDFQWNYTNSGLFYPFKKGMDINVLPVWEKYTCGSPDVIVAVIDNGIQMDHHDLRGVVLTADEGSRNFTEGSQPDELVPGSHGTHVAGTIAAINNNGIAVAGIAGGRDGKGGVRIMNCTSFSPEGTGSMESIAAALVWAADHGAVIANNSWTFVNDEETTLDFIASFEEGSSPVRIAIDYFIRYAGTDPRTGEQTGPMKGGLVVFSAGNESAEHSYPPEYSGVVAVGAFGPDGKMTEYSNYGPWVDILAPGGSDSKTTKEGWVLSLDTNNQMAFECGTSMACPHVAGVAALLVSYYGGPGFTADMLKDALLGGAKPGVIDLRGRTVGGGKLDAEGAFDAMNEPEHPGPADIRFVAGYTGDWQFKSHESLDFPIMISGNGKAQLPVSVSSDCPGVTAEISSPRRILLHINALQADPGSYTATVQVGTLAAHTMDFTILPNHAPRLVAPLENLIVNVASTAASTIDLGRYFQDPDGEQLRFRMNADSGIDFNFTLKGSILTITPDGTKANGYGQGTVRVEALDARQESAESDFKLLLRNTHQDLDIFPNPVSTTLQVRPGTDRTASVELVNAVGTTVYRNPSVTIGPFDPLAIDMDGMPGGTYSLFVNGQRFSVVKR